MLSLSDLFCVLLTVFVCLNLTVFVCLHLVFFLSIYQVQFSPQCTLCVYLIKLLKSMLPKVRHALEIQLL